MQNPDLIEINEESPNVKCVFCSKSQVNTIEWGQMYQLKDLTLHYFCMLFSSGLEQKGDDHEGVLGFLMEDLRKEIRRGEKLKCKICHTNRATVGCTVKTCKRSFHFTCGVEKGTLHQYGENYPSFCRQHKPVKKIPEELSWQCEVCFADVENTEDTRSGNPVWPPCCKRRVFHRYCIQQYALNSGYYFGCPSCRNTEDFTIAMKNSGVYVPEQDATWEREPGAYADLNAQHSTCDAEECLCPEVLGGRNHNSEEQRSWKIVRCNTCASSAIHYSCGQLRSSSHWKCPGCAVVYNAGPTLRQPRAIETVHSHSEGDDEFSSDEEGGDEQSRSRNQEFKIINENCRLHLAVNAFFVGLERHTGKIDHPRDILYQTRISAEDNEEDDDDDEGNERSNNCEPLEQIIDEKKIIMDKTYKKKYRMEMTADTGSSSEDEEYLSKSSHLVVGSRFVSSCFQSYLATQPTSPSSINNNIQNVFKYGKDTFRTKVGNMRSQCQSQNDGDDKRRENPGKMIHNMISVTNLGLDEHYGRSANAAFPHLLISAPDRVVDENVSGNGSNFLSPT